MEKNNSVGTDEPNLIIEPDENNKSVGTDECNTATQQDEKNNSVGENKPIIAARKKKKGLRVGMIVFISVISTIVSMFLTSIVAFFLYDTLQHPPVSLDGRTHYEYYATGRVKTESVYDDNGLLAEQTRYDDEGFFAGNSKYHYDENGKLKTEEKYQYDMNDVTVKEYDENKKVFRESRYKHDELFEVILYEYDSLDRKIKESHYSSSDDLKYWLTYQYHEKTGWLTWIKYDASGKMEDSGGYSIPK